MRPLMLVATGCWTNMPPETPKPTSCQVEERLVEPAGRAKLSVRDVQFAEIAGPFVKINVRVTDTTAHAVVENDKVVLDGDLALEELPLRPKQLALHDHWLEVVKAKGRTAIGGSLRLDVELPAGFEPSSTSIDLPCDRLTFAVAKRPERSPDLRLRRGHTTTLYRRPGAQPIATWTAPKYDPDVPHEDLDATELERTGSYIKVRILGTNDVVAWVAAAVMEPVSDDLYGGLLGTESGGSVRTIECPHRVPIYVRADGQVTHIGTTKPDANFLTGATRASELKIQLGGTANPFLERKDLQQCRYQ